MTLEEFLKKQNGGNHNHNHNHNWLAYDDYDYLLNYKCTKCNLTSVLAWTAASCISDDEAAIKNILE